MMPRMASSRAAREAMQVAWYVTAGKLDTESTGRASDDGTFRNTIQRLDGTGRGGDGALVGRAA